MQEELQSKLVEILSSIQQAAGKAGDFAMAQLPDIAQSYVVYGRFLSIFGILMSAAGLYAVYVFFKWARTIKEEMHFGVTFGGIGAFFVMLASVTAFYLNVSEAALVWFSPKVWLLREIAGMLK